MKIFLGLVLGLAACGGAPDPVEQLSSSAVAPSCVAKADDNAHPACLAYGDAVVTCNGGYSPDSQLGPDQLCFGPADTSGADPQIYCCHAKPDSGAKCDNGAPAPPGVCDAGHPRLVTCNYPSSSSGEAIVPPLKDQGTKRGYVWCTIAQP